MDEPGQVPYTDVTFCGVYWNDADRVGRLLERMRPWFANVLVGVQASPDSTLEVCRRFADGVIEDAHRGYCEPTLSRVVASVRTEWCFVVSADEMPDRDLLDSFQAMVDHAAGDSTIDGYWIRFISSIDAVEYPSESDNHLRFFRTRLGWPITMHSRPDAAHAEFWTTGRIRHDRSLDEMIRDYLRYFELGRGDAGWEAHNRLMIHDACAATARHKGWPYVRAFDWWPEAATVAFIGESPWATGGPGPSR